MTYPNFPEKHISKALFSPDDSESYRQRTGEDYFSELPCGIIMCYSRQLVKYVTTAYPAECIKAFYGSNIYLIENKGKKIGVAANFGFGAPVAVAMTEQLISYGIRNFINLGIAGTLQKHIDIGDIIVCNKAIRDEGTSYHYVNHEKYAVASSDMTDIIQKNLMDKNVPYHLGSTWTIDAPYRETIDEVQHYQKEGVLTVEMEASALFTVAAYRGVEMGSIFTVSDSLAEPEWKPAFRSEKTQKGLETIFSVSLDVLSSLS